MSSLATARLQRAIAATALLVSGLIVAWPVFSEAGLLYLDNPAHLADVATLAAPDASGWSDLAWCGFPLTGLQSPLYYGWLAVLARLGVPPEVSYLASLFAGFVASPLTAFFVLSRRLSTPVAFVLSYALLTYRGASVGAMAALGGMFTFYLAAALWIVLLERLARSSRSAEDVAIIALCVGLIGLLHVFVTIAVMLLAAIHMVHGVVTARRWTRALWVDTLAFALGGLCSSRYTLMALTIGASDDPTILNESRLVVMERLLLGFMSPSEHHDVIPRVLSDPTWYVDAAVQLVLWVLGLWAVRTIITARPRDRVALYGLWVAVTLSFLLLVVLPGTNLRLLGPQSYRLVYFIKIGLLFAAAPLLGRRLTAAGRGLVPLAATVILGVTSAFSWQRHVRLVMATEPEMASVKQLWAFLQAARRPDWGRVYLQDTYDVEETGRFSSSHVLALTAHRSGVAQVGAYYGALPFATSRWLRSEDARWFDVPIGSPGSLDELLRGMESINATHLVLVRRVNVGLVRDDARFERLFDNDTFSVFRRKSAVSQWVRSEGPVAWAEAVAKRPGDFAITYDTYAPGGRLLLPESHSPLWRLVPPLGRVVPTTRALTAIESLPVGRGTLQLVFHVPVWPLLLSLTGFALTACIVPVSRRLLRGRTSDDDDRRSDRS